MKSTVWAFIFLMITCSSYAQTVFFYEKYDYIISAINDFRSHPIEYAKVLNIQESELNAKWSLDNISLEMDPVKEEESLFWMANSHLEEMMEFNFIGHSSRNNFSLEDRALYFGYRGIFVGESVIMLCFEDFVSKDKALDILLESLFKDALLKETREGAPLLFKPYTDIGVAFGASKIKINNIEYNAYILCIDFGVYYTDTYFLGRIFEENKIFIPENSIKYADIYVWRNNEFISTHHTTTFPDGSFYLEMPSLDGPFWVFIRPKEQDYCSKVIYTQKSNINISLSNKEQ